MTTKNSPIKGKSNSTNRLAKRQKQFPKSKQKQDRNQQKLKVNQNNVPKINMMEKGTNKVQLTNKIMNNDNEPKKKSVLVAPQNLTTRNDPTQYFSESVNFMTENQINQRRKNSVNEIENKSPSFERSSRRVSLKRHNVSLVSLNQTKNSVARSQRPRSVLSKISQIQSNKNTKQKDKRILTGNGGHSQQQDQKWLKQNIKLVHNVSIKKIYEEFKKQIEQPMNFQAQMSKSENPAQRCIDHNTDLSLYCCVDRQVLCVGCIFSQKSHKNHRVIPMIKSQKQMKQDTQSFKNRIQSTLQQSQSLIRQSSLNLIKIQKQYPTLIHKIQTYYVNIHQFIEQKKREQLDYIQNLRAQLKNEMKTIRNLLNSVSTFFIDKIRQISYQAQKMKKNPNQSLDKSFQKNPEKSDDPQLIQNIVKKRCNYQILARYHKILNRNSDQLFDQKKGFEVKLDNFDQVLDLIKYKLTMVIPVIKREFQESTRKKGFTNIMLKQTSDRKPTLELPNAQINPVEKSNLNPTPNKETEKKSQNQKGFSTSPQVPRGLSRRFIELSTAKYSPLKNTPKKTNV